MDCGAFGKTFDEDPHLLEASSRSGGADFPLGVMDLTFRSEKLVL
jgi:hypothetical protein